jgi:hypothetical protein
MKIIDDQTIVLERELNDLDKFVLRFTKILEKYTNYVLISGYVAILFGRSRGTEDVDLFIEKISKEKFIELYRDLQSDNLWAINADDQDELFSMLNEGLAIRFAEKGQVIPNMEMKFTKDFLDEFAMKNKIKVETEEGILWTSKIGMQIAYKKFVLKSKKDLEDAQHLQKLFDINEEKINKYKLLFAKYGRI